MPRSTKDSDEEVEPKTGRKIRGFGTAVTDSPLRRSSRIKQPVKHYDTSPDSSVSDTSNTGNTQTTRTSRRRTMNIDSESLRNMRSRKNSVSSDISEATEGEAPPHTPSKRITRRSLAATPARDTPKPNTRSTNRRLVRAGSETKSSPPPVVRTTHKTRASSMGPESTREQKERKQVDTLDTYFKGRKRASILPSESTVAEESEESEKSSRLQLETALPEVEENESDITDSSSKSSPNKLSTSLKDKSESEDSKIQPETPENASETSSAIAEKTSADTTNIPTAPQNPEETSKELGLKTENLLNTGKEEGKSPRSKENQRLNLMNEITSERKGEPVVSIVKLVTSKHFTCPLTHKSVNEKENISPRSEINVKRRLSKDVPETVVKESVDITKESIDINNVIESNDTDDTNSSIIIAKAIEDSSDEKVDDDFSKKDQDCAANDSTISLAKATSNETLKGNSLELSNEYSLKLSDKSIVNEDSTQDTSKTDNNATIMVTTDEGEDCNKTIPEFNETLNKSTKPAHQTSDQISDQTLDQTSKEESVKQDATENNADTTQTINVSNETEDINDISMISVEMDSQSDLTKNDTAINPSSKANESIAADTPKEIQKSLTAETSLTLEPTESELPKTADDKGSTEVSEEPVKSASPNKNEGTDSPSLVETAENESEAERKINSPEKESQLETSQTTPPKSNKDADNIDSDSNVGNLFHDIPADEWKRKENSSKGAEVENSSVHSMSTERLGNESEAECDLVLVDKEAWLAAEHMRAAKEKEPFDYDSDDTVVLKSRIDSLRCKSDTVPKMSTICEMDVDSDEEDCGTKRRKSLHTRKSLPKDENTEKVEEPTDIDDVNEDNSPDRDTTSKLNTSRRKSITEKTPQAKKQNVTESKPTKFNLSQRDSTEENKSLNESMENVSLEDQDKSPQEDANTSVEEDKVKSQLPQEGSAKKRVSLNKSKIEDNSSNLLKTPKSGNRDTTVLSEKTAKKLNVSLNKTLESKQLNLSKKSSLSTSLLNKDDFSTEESDESKHELSKLSQKSSTKKRKINRNYSTVVHVDSDSESNNIESDSDDSKDQGSKISRILFASNSSDDDADSNKSMDSDIKEEYNLDGKNVSKFSDDDIPGDECRASESESSDPNDNGSDLADFVVDDDEVEDEMEDEEESDNDSDAVDVEENDEENEEEKDLVDSEGEEKGSLLIWSDEDKEKEEEEKIDNMNVKDEDEEMSLSEMEEEEEKEEDEEDSEEQKSENEEIIEPPKSCKKEKSDKENSRESILSRTPASETKKNRSKIKEVDEEHEEEKKTLSSSPLESLKKQKKSKSQHAIQITEMVTGNQIDEFSEISFTRKSKKLNISMECSTPKTDACKNDKFDMSMQTSDAVSENKNKKNTSSLLENVPLKKKSKGDLSLKKDTSLRILNHSTEKESLLHKSLPIDLTELVEKANLPKPISSKFIELNKSTLTPHTDSPTTRYLKKEKLNESAPLVRVNENKKSRRSIINQEDVMSFKKEDIIEEYEEIPKLSKTPKRKILKETNEIPKDNQTKAKKRKNIMKVQSEVQADEEPPEDVSTSPLKKKKQTEFSSTSEISSMEVCKPENKKKRTKKKKREVDAEHHTVAESEINEKVDNEENEINIEEAQPTKKKKKNKNKSTISSQNIHSDTDNQVTVSKKHAIEEVPEITEEVSKKKKKKNKSQQKNTSTGASPQSKVFKKQQTVDNSYEAPERVSFTKALEEALEAIKRATGHVKTNKEMKKKNNKEIVEKVQQQKNAKEQKLQRKQNDKVGKTEIIKTESKNLKRLSDEIIDSLSETPTRPKKKQKIQKKEEHIMPSRSMFSIVSNENVEVNDDFVPLHSSGSTTQFKIANLKKIKKRSKKAPAVAAFRQRILSRNSREPISAYLMYLQKEKATGKDKFTNKPF